MQEEAESRGEGGLVGHQLSCPMQTLPPPQETLTAEKSLLAGLYAGWEATARSWQHQANKTASTYELFVRLSSQEVEVLSPQHSVGKQVGEGHGREGGSSALRQSQRDHSNEERRKPGACSRAQRRGVTGEGLPVLWWHLGSVLRPPLSAAPHKTPSPLPGCAPDAQESLLLHGNWSSSLCFPLMFFGRFPLPEQSTGRPLVPEQTGRRAVGEEWERLS